MHAEWKEKNMVSQVRVNDSSFPNVNVL